MSTGDAEPKAEKLELDLWWSRRNLREHGSESASRVAARSVERFKDKVRQLVRQGRGRNLERFIEKDLNPVVRGWANYYRKAIPTRSGVRGCDQLSIFEI